MKPRRLSVARLSFALASAIAALFAAQSAHATTITWDANAGTALQTDGAGVWLTANQWWNGSANVNWTSGDDAVFGNGGAGGAVTLASGTTVNSLTFNSFTGTYTLGTSTQTITLNNGITMNSGAGAATLISPITLGAAQSWTNNDDSLLTIGTGAVTNGGFLLTVGGTGNTTVSSVIQGSGGLTKTGAGILTLSGANTFTGQTNVNVGTLKLGNASALGTAAGNTVVSTGAVLDLGGFSTTDPLSLIGSGIGGTGALSIPAPVSRRSPAR